MYRMNEMAMTAEGNKVAEGKQIRVGRRKGKRIRWGGMMVKI